MEARADPPVSLGSTASAAPRWSLNSTFVSVSAALAEGAFGSGRNRMPAPGPSPPATVTLRRSATAVTSVSLPEMSSPPPLPGPSGSERAWLSLIWPPLNAAWLSTSLIAPPIPLLPAPMSARFEVKLVLWASTTLPSA